MTDLDIGSYLAHVKADSGEIAVGLLGPASTQDIPSAGWRCDWQNILANSDPKNQRFIKLSYLGQVLGLIHYGVYSYQGKIPFLEIEHLEANPPGGAFSNGYILEKERSISPVGRWLIWYASKVALSVLKRKKALIVLTSWDEALEYYRDKIGMEYVKAVTIAAGEDGHVLRFSRSQAEKFCRDHEHTWDVPTPVSLS